MGLATDRGRPVRPVHDVVGGQGDVRPPGTPAPRRRPRTRASRNALLGSAYWASGLASTSGTVNRSIQAGGSPVDRLGPGGGLDVQRPEVVVLGPEEGLLAEELEAAGRRPGRHLVPDADQRGGRAARVREPQRRGRRRCPGTRRRTRSWRRDRLGRPEHPVDDVEVVDRVLDERPAARLVHVRCARSSRTCPGSGSTGRRAGSSAIGFPYRPDWTISATFAEHRRVAQHQPDLVRHRGEQLGDAPAVRQRRRERLLAEHREVPRDGGLDRREVTAGPGADPRDVDLVEQGVECRRPASRGSARPAAGPGPDRCRRSR